MPQFDDELCEDEFEIIEGPVDRKLYRQHTNSVLLEFSKEGVRGGMGSKGEMKVIISFKEIFSFTCLFPTGFPRAKRPVVYLSNPDPHIVSHPHVDKDGRITLPDLVNWNYEVPLGGVLRTVYNCFLENPPRLNSSAIVWNLKKEAAPAPPPPSGAEIPERKIKHIQKVKNAPPLNDFPTTVCSEPKATIAPPVEIVIPRVPDFESVTKDMTLSQLEKTSDDTASLVTVMTEEYSGSLNKCIDVSNRVVADAEKKVAASSEAVLQATLKKTQLAEEVTDLKEQANILMLTRSDITNRASSDTITKLTNELQDASSLLEALGESMNSESAHLDSDFLFGTYHTAAARCNLLRLKLNALKAEQSQLPVNLC
eukprot:TRINITY_DN6939_c0_g1_i1.p1 TRINITY_DN6939_c0_g1~~TRINITY_DN6939_c0_g1_i1.p1  ORF type:complete len:369 (+),score=68.16 TRINITY_DN6939_c0_g1_i1:83-1189(+)